MTTVSHKSSEGILMGIDRAVLPKIMDIQSIQFVTSMEIFTSSFSVRPHFGNSEI